MINPSGTLFYADDYGQQYHVEWSTSNGIIDITTITMQPYVWGEEAKGYIENNILYRYGIVSVIRQLLKPLTSGYEIISEGYSQSKEYFRTNFNCVQGPSDDFKYHLNCGLVDEEYFITTEGSHWSTGEDDDMSTWYDVDTGGTGIDLTGDTYPSEEMTWVDVWA